LGRPSSVRLDAGGSPWKDDSSTHSPDVPRWSPTTAVRRRAIASGRRRWSTVIANEHSDRAWSRPHGGYERTPRGRGRPVPYTASTTRYGWIRTEHGRFGALRRMRAKGRQSRDRRVPSEEMVAESPSPQSPGDTTGQGRLAAFRKAEE